MIVPPGDLAYLARGIVNADQHIRDAVARCCWLEAQTWQDTRDRLADERYKRMRDKLYERWEQRAA